MALWDNERRILDEIEQQLSEDDPALASRLNTFGEAAPSPPPAVPPAGGQRARWVLWLVVGVLITVVVTVLGLLVSVSLSGGTGGEDNAGAVVTSHA